MRAGDFEVERGRRAALLADLVARGALDLVPSGLQPAGCAVDAPVVGD